MISYVKHGAAAFAAAALALAWRAASKAAPTKLGAGDRAFTPARVQRAEGREAEQAARESAPGIAALRQQYVLVKQHAAPIAVEGLRCQALIRERLLRFWTLGSLNARWGAGSVADAELRGGCL